MPNIILIGPPGAGKGTMAEKLVEVSGMVHISTGDILREEIAKGSALGKTAKGYISAGKLLPDDVVVGIVAGKLAEPEIRGNGFLLDGFPRTIPQAEALDTVLAGKGVVIDGVVLLDVPEAVLCSRLTSRRICSACKAVYNVIVKPPRQDGVCDLCGGAVVQRPDDTLETAKERLAVYVLETAPIIDYYGCRGLVRKVNADGEVAAVFSRIRELLSI